MSALDAFVLMLSQAKIPCTQRQVMREEIAYDRDRSVFPEWVTIIMVTSYNETGSIDSAPEGEQPLANGYFGFYTEIVFDPEGNLLAIWSWE